MKYIYTLIISLSTITCISAQTKTPTESTSDSVYLFVDHMPEFPGGIPKLSKFIEKNLNYPEEALKANVTGTVFASFVIGKDGTIQNLFIAKGIGYGCDQEVLRVLRLMPTWSPGILNGQPVPVRFAIPVNFGLTRK
ncbi:energy transducer TonB [Cytophagaceae bacterium DM2B3-1]|uniref:Energy transducer TonB n=1 Tax=Xanthocytophaga flava TaxID=3048013 RepID=A0ABT7CL86_9BACT|nr:energy transducer TonB [Xanthocytophaga flavus]MDJ1469945.1 energy transducer TonB [Xanthocytophaga flavus]MDJ1494455.1 energy transducer TonB [Xanthocytophaga flavus]